MAVGPRPDEIFDRAVAEGERRLEQSVLELVATSFIAGFTIVFGIVGMGVAHALFEPEFGGVARAAGALAFAPGLVFLIIGRAELFSENFFDPAATVIVAPDSWTVQRLLRLWAGTFSFNLVGGAALALVVSVPGALPAGAPEALGALAEASVRRGAGASFANAVLGGALIALLSYLLAAVETAGSRIALSYMAGFLLALGPFEHVVVTVLQALFGVGVGAEVPLSALASTTAVVTAGNFVGGIGLVTLAHVARVRGARASAGGQR